VSVTRGQCGTEAWLTRSFTTYMCYHTKFGSFRLKHLGVSRVSHNCWGCVGTLGLGMSLTPRNMLLANLCYGTKFGHSRPNHMSVMEICQKILTPHVLLFKVIQGHWNQRGWISDPQTIVTMGLSCTISEIKGDNWKILPPLCI